MLDVQPRLNRQRFWLTSLMLVVVIGALAAQWYATGNGVSIDDAGAANTYAAKHLRATFAEFPRSLLSDSPTPAYPSLLALIANLRHIEPVQAAAALNLVLFAIMLAGFATLSLRGPGAHTYWLFALIVLASTFSLIGTQVNSNLIGTAAFPWAGMSFLRKPHKTHRALDVAIDLGWVAVPGTFPEPMS